MVGGSILVKLLSLMVALFCPAGIRMLFFTLHIFFLLLFGSLVVFIRS